MFAAISNRITTNKSGLQMSAILITVKFTSSCACSLEVELNSSVFDVKQKISQQLGIPVKEIQLILAGRILDDGAVVKDLCIGNCTVLHGFQQKTSAVTVDVKQTLKTNSQTETVPNKTDYQYFVFCKDCQSLQPGKLRVMCATCGGGQIILLREPENFDDVLQCGHITGECKSHLCNGQHRAAKFYFKCACHQAEEAVAVLKHVRPNRKQIECLTCTEISSPILVFPCRRHHVICLECFKTYCIMSLNDRRFVEDQDIGYSLPCPAGCDNSLIRDAHHFCLIGQEQYERYKNFATEEYVLQNGGILCPAPNCGTGFIVENMARKVTCPNCEHIFCRDCLSRFHEDVECRTELQQEAAGTSNNLSREQELHARWDMESLRTIEKISKPCPNCKTKIEKDEGCMHMICTRCYFEWCWLCQKEWNRDCQGNHWFG